MRKVFAMMLLCAALMGVLFPGARAEGSEADQRHLRISATVNADAGFTNIPLEQGNYKELSLLNLENVTIDLDGAALTLEPSGRGGSPRSSWSPGPGWMPARDFATKWQNPKTA